MPGVNFFQVSGLQRRVGVGRNRQRGARAEKRLQRKSHIGAIPHLTGRGAEQLGQTLPSLLLRCRDANPTAVAKLLNGLRVSWRDSHCTVATASGGRIANTPQRRDNVSGKFRGFIE